MDKQQLARQIWSAADSMRGSLDANDYKDLILGFMFYKYLSEREIEHFERDIDVSQMPQALDGTDFDIVQDAKLRLGYFIEYDDLFSSWLEKRSDLTFGDLMRGLDRFDSNIDSARHHVFSGIFTSLRSSIGNLGSKEQTQMKVVRDVLKIVSDIPSANQKSYDVLGYVYEYLIGHFAADAGRKSGEFYTPHQVALVMADIVADHLRDAKELRVYDPTSGSASLLLNIGSAIAKHSGDPNKIRYYAQELRQDAFNLTRMNLVMRGVLPSNISLRHGDSLDEDWPLIDANGNFDPLLVNAVVSNPPYSAKWKRDTKIGDPRFSYGLAPKTKADYAFLLHELYHLDPDGILTIVLPHGVLFRSGEEATIRRKLIENHHIETIIGLPPNIFYGTGIATIIMVLKRNRTDDSILFVDASKGFEKNGNKNELRARDVRKIVDTVTERRAEDGYSHIASIEEVRSNQHNLNITRYVDSGDEAETWDIYATMFGGIPMSEIDSLSSYWNALPGMKESLFSSISDSHTSLRDEIAVTELVADHESAARFRSKYLDTLDGFEPYMAEVLLDLENSTKDPSSVESALRFDLFSRLSSVELVDPYEVYQFFANHWADTESDLELISREGWSVTCEVAPNMVTRKKDGEEITEPKGWVGRILPFDLVQRVLLADDLLSLEETQKQQQDAENRLEELFGMVDEEDYGSDDDTITNKDGTAFISKGVTARLNDLLADVTSVEIQALEEFIDLRKKADKEKFVKGHPEVDWASLDRTKTGFSKTSIKKRITSLRRAADFEPGSLEEILAEAERELANASEAKKSAAEQYDALHEKTKEVIENLSDDEVRELLKVKWVDSVMADFNSIPDIELARLSEAVKHLDEKYSTTMSDVQVEIATAESALVSMLGQMTGSEKDMEGMRALQEMLGGADRG